MSERGADVVVIGGGPAGAAAAIGLRRAGARVALFERSTYESPRVGEAVPPAIGPALAELGVSLDFEREHLRAAGTSAAWGSDSLGYHDFLRSAEGPGFHLDRARFDRALSEAARASGARVMTGVSVTGLRPRSGGGFILSIHKGGGRGANESLEAGFVVDATGRRAVIATAAGAAKVYFDNLMAVSAVFSLETKARGEGFAVIESAEDLWWYQAALPGRRAVVVCLTDADLVKAGRLFDEEEWSRRLAATSHIHARVADASGRTRLSLHNARTQALDRPFGEGWIAVGDAALSYDPLSSAGIVKALRSGLAAASAAAAHLSGDSGALAGYARGVERALDVYLDGRRRHYLLEARWPEAPFWRRRRAGVTLSPTALLRLSDSGAARDALSRCAAYLPPDDLRRITSLCEEPRPASEVVALLRREGHGRSDRRVIEALQHLIDRGLLDSALPDSSRRTGL